MIPQISILIPVKNAAKWLHSTIDSIQSQTFPNWEVIAVDDGSEDESFELLTQFSQEDERINVFKNADSGIIPALQFALRKSSGTFITRMDADDLMPENRLQLFFESIQNTTKTVVTGKVQYFSEDKVSGGYLKYENWLNERVDKNDFYNQIYRECVVASPNWMALKTDLIESRIFEMQYPEDYDMVFRWFANGFKIKPIPDLTLLWREHPARTSRNSLVYEQKSFFKLKMKWWKQLNQSQFESIGILGAGEKGKLVLNEIQELNVRLFDLNWKQKNQEIKGLVVEDYNKLNTSCVLVAIYPDDRQRSKIENFLQSKSYSIGENFWYI